MTAHPIPEPVRLAVLEWARLNVRPPHEDPPELTVREVAEILEMHPATVHWSEKRAMEKLRKRAQRIEF